jgi:hypothetical protein
MDVWRGMHPGKQHQANRSARVLLALLLAVSLLPLALPGAEAGPAIQNPYSRIITAPVVALTGSHDAQHVAVLDSEARYTFLLDAGDRERTWQPPAKGYLSLLDPTIGEVDPRPIGISMSPNGNYWAGATAYSGSFGGRVDGFAHWSDDPIWTLHLSDGSGSTPAVQPTVIASGGNYHGVGTSEGKVHVLSVGGNDGTNKKPLHSYKQSNDGVPFNSIRDLVISRDGGLFLIASENSGTPSLHLFTDTFFKASFHRITQPVQLIAISDDGSRGAAVTGSGDNARVHFLDTQRGITIWEHTIGSTVRSMALSEDGSLLVVGTSNGRVHLYQETGSLIDGEPRRVFSFDAGVTSVDAADDGHAAVAVTDNGRVHLLDLRRDRALWSHATSSNAVSVKMSGDQQMIVVGSIAGDEGRVTYLPATHELDHMLPPSPRLLPSSTQELPIQLANNGNRMETVEVHWRSLPTNWKGHESNISLAPTETGTLGAKLTVPTAQPKGDYELIFDLVTRTDTIEVEMEVRVPEVTAGETTLLWSFEQAVGGGAPAAFLIKLENTGNTMNELALGYSGVPAEWGAEFTGARETKLRPGEDRQVVLTVRAPVTAQIGDEIWFDLVIAWQHGEERHPLRVEVVDPVVYKDRLRTIDRDRDGDPTSDDNVAGIVEHLLKESDRPVLLQSDPETDNAAIPYGTIMIPLGAIAAALAGTLLVVRRQRNKKAARLMRETRRK